MKTLSNKNILYIIIFSTQLILSDGRIYNEHDLEKMKILEMILQNVSILNNNHLMILSDDLN